MKLEAASPAPTCASDGSDQSMDRPIVFKRMKQGAASPAPTCASDGSDQSMDRPIVFKRMKLEAASPAPTCASDASDQSMDRPIVFKHGMKLEAASPALTCASDASDQSMDRPIVFKRVELETTSPAPSCVSEYRMKLEAASPAPTFASAASDQSMDRPIVFKHTVKLEAASPAPTFASAASDQSMDRPIVFKRPSPAPTCIFMNSEHLMTPSPMFSRGEEAVGELSACLLTEDHFRCPVCTDVLKEPVSTPCGHSYCKTCIQTYWNKPTHEGSYSCPQCRKMFKTRPELNPNSALAEVVQKLQQAGFSPALPAHCYAGPDDVSCDFCTGRKLRAVKSCLTCSASYCEAHVKQHYTVPALQRHTLVEATVDLEERLCKLHHRALEVFCRTDQTFICFICIMEEHKGHEFILSKSEDSTVEANTQKTKSQIIPLNSLQESEMDKPMKELLKEIEELRVKTQRAETELAFMAKSFCRGLEEPHDFTSEFVEVAALGRWLDLGMLYDCCNDSFSSDVFLWDVDTVSSMKLSLPRPHTDVRILEGDSLQERLRALGLTTALRASVVSGLVEVAGAASFLKHPTQSQLQDRVTLHYRTSTRLDMLSHRLLHSGAPFSVTNQSSATHVVVAVLYGGQAFFVFDNESESKEGNAELQATVQKMISSYSESELRSSLTESEQDSTLLYNCSLYFDADYVKSPVRFDTAVKLYSSLPKRLGPKSEKAVPLKVWLYPLKNLDQMFPHIVRDIREDLLAKAENVLENYERTIRTCQDLLCSFHNLSVIKWFPALKQDLCQFSELVKQFKSLFQKGLASCIKIIRQREEEGEQDLRDLLVRNDLSPFSLQNTQQWLRNKDAEVRALNECRAVNITIIKSRKDLSRVIENYQVDRVMCFTLTSLEGEDPFLSALKQHIDLVNISVTHEMQPPFRLPEISQKILFDLRSFLSSSETDSNTQQIQFIAASVPDQEFPGSSIRLYQSGALVSRNVKLAVRLGPPELVAVRQMSVVLNLNKNAYQYRVQYRVVIWRGHSSVYLKWSSIDITGTRVSSVIRDLQPETQYQLRYAVMDSNSMSDYSRITEFQTLPSSRPGQPTALKQNTDSLTVTWQSAEADGDSPVLRYMVEYMEAGLEGWQSVLTEGPECEYTITLPYSTCYRVRVSAVYGEGDTSKHSEETEVPLHAWNIDLSKRKSSLLLEVLKLQTVKKPVELRGCSDEESEVRSFLQCLPYISQLRFRSAQGESAEWRKRVNSFLLDLCLQAALHQKEEIHTTVEKLISCSHCEEGDFLLDLFSHVKKYETETGRSVLPALQPVYQSAPAVWIIDLSERKSSLLLEVLKLQTVNKPVELRGCSDEESEVRSFLQCLPYISQLSFDSCEEAVLQLVVKLIAAAAECDSTTAENFTKLLTSVCSYTTALFREIEEENDDFYSDQSDLLLDLCSHVKKYETDTGRSVLPALQPVYQSAPAVWIINLSERKSSLLLEVLKLQSVKKPVELRGCSDEESEVRSFLQCLPYISQLSFRSARGESAEWRKRVNSFLLDLCLQAALHQKEEIHTTVEKLISCARCEEDDFLLDLCSHVKKYETETGRSVLPALQPVYQSAPAVWIINLSERKSSLLLEVLKLQTVKKPVELRGWSDEESEVRSFLQCLPYISQLRFRSAQGESAEWRKRVNSFLLDLCLQAALHQKEEIHTTVEKLISCAHCEKGDFLLDLFSHVKKYETETGRSVLPALQPVYQSVPAVWIINLSERKSSLLLEVLKLQTEKKPVELRGCSDEESEVRSFLQCLPYISQLRVSHWSDIIKHSHIFLDLYIKAAECERQTGEKTLELLTSVCSYSSFPYGVTDSFDQSDFLLDLFSHVKKYETETGRSVLPALQPVYQSAPAVWIIDLSERKSSLLLEVLKLQSVKKPVELRGCSDEESEVRSFLQCLPYISQLRFRSAQGESDEWRKRVKSFLLDLCLQAALHQKEEIHTTVEKLISCARCEKGDFLLDLFSHVKKYETETGRSVLPALQPVYQSAPAVWIINLSERKSSLLLEVLKLQTVKKPVELWGCSDEESEVRSFLQCLPYISQLSFGYWGEAEQFVVKLIAAAAECDSTTGENFTKLLTSVCSYTTFPYREIEEENEYFYSFQSDLLLDLCSHVKKYETETGRSVLPALQPVYQSAPAVWIINLSERKSSLLLEVLKLQTEKKPVELWGCSDEESEVRSFLQCLPYISQLSFGYWGEAVLQLVVKLIAAAAECDSTTGENFTKLLTSVCSYTSFPYREIEEEDDDFYSFQSDFLLDLCSHVKKYETDTGRSVLPALQPVYQSAPAVWIIDLSERKSSLLLEVLKLQTVKKPVELWGCSDEESEVRSFLQCLPYISQLSFDSCEEAVLQLVVKLIAAAAECDSTTGENLTKLLTSVCSYTTFPFREIEEENDDFYSDQSDLLLDLCSHVKKYETETGRSVLPALQPVYQSAPAVWIIDLSERKSSLLLEVLKLQTVKKPVELWGCSDEESEVRSFLQCLPYISQLSFGYWGEAEQFVVKLIAAAAECDSTTGENFTKLLTSVCSYTSFPFREIHEEDDDFYSKQTDFLLDLFSHVKKYETETGRSVLPALQSVYQSAPAVWIINLSERKSSLLLEVLKLQTVKKPVELRGWSDEESEVRSFLQCLPYISQLRDADQFVPSLCKALQSATDTEQMTLLLQALDFTLSLEGKLPTSCCRAVGRVLQRSASKLNLTLNPQAISLRGSRCLLRHITHLRTFKLSAGMVVKVERALRAVRAPAPVTIEELSLIQSRTTWTGDKLSRVLSSLASLLRVWNVQCLNLTEHTIEAQSLTVLLCLQDHLTIRVSKETLLQLLFLVYEAQEGEFTRSFLQKVGGDLSSCSLQWKVIQYFLQYHTVTVDFRKSSIKQQNIRELLTVLDRVQLRRLNTSFLLSIIREIYETGSAHYVSSLLSSTENCINLNSRELDTVHCAALRFTLQHCRTVSLSLLWTSIPEGELESIVPLLNHVSHLSVDRLLLLRLIHCCSVQQGAAAALLSALQHRLDLSCSSALDLAEHTQTHTLSTKDCRVISMVIQRAPTHTQLILQDCEMEEAAVEQLFSVLHTVRLRCSKALLLQFLALVHVGTELECVRRAASLSRALGEELDLSQTRLDLQACRSLALFLEHSEGLSELDLSHCQITDHCLELLLPHLHKTCILDLSHNDITDVSAKRIYHVVSVSSNTQTVRLFNNRITDRQLFLSDRRFEIW